MKKLVHYIKKLDSAAFIPYYDDFGKLVTFVLEANQYFTVEKTPYYVMDKSLRYYGTSMRGAKDGVKEILGNVNMSPVIVNVEHGMYWLPTKSPRAADCAWLCLAFIFSCKDDGQGGSIVTLTTGDKIHLDVECLKLKNRIHQTYVLKCEIEKRIKLMQQRKKQRKSVRIKLHNNRIQLNDVEDE